MTAAAIAFNRFGLGARGDEPAVPDPKRWLLGQLDRFEPRPAALRSVPSPSQVGVDLAAYYASLRMRLKARAEMRDAAAAMPQGSGMKPQQPDGARDLQRGLRQHHFAMTSARLNSALTTSTPFVERLVHFWANHFAISADRVPLVGLAGLLEFEAIRSNILGRFSDMLVAVEQHPAMLIYLDQAQSIGPDSPASQSASGRRKGRRGLNENLGREILELHTLGVNGGYTQADVTELARALTGWTVAGLTRGPVARFVRALGKPASFAYADVLHQPGTRQILGRTYSQSGDRQAHAILADLAVHPSTARHLATKLSRHFAGDEPPPAMVERLSRAYLASGGDLPTVYRAIIDSPEAWAERPAKFKSPWEWAISSLRALGASELRPRAGTELLTQLGQPTWRPGSPAGWPDTAPNWAAPDALLRRLDAVQRMASLVRADVDPRALAERVLPGTLSDATRAAISRAESPAQGLALLLVSPEFMKR